jgi:hypothetical protein
MPLEAYRVCRGIHAALDGEGAFRAAGRWNSPGRRMVYMAQSVALAVVENLVHMSRQDFPTAYVCIAAEAANPGSLCHIGSGRQRTCPAPRTRVFACSANIFVDFAVMPNYSVHVTFPLNLFDEVRLRVVAR